MGCSASLDSTAHLVRLANDAKSQKETGPSGERGWSHDSGMSDSSFMPSQIPTIIVTPPSALPPKDATRHAAATTLAPPDAGGTPRKVGQGGVTHPAATAYVVSPAYSAAVAMDAAKRQSARPPPLSAVATGGGMKTLPSRDSHSSVGARDDGTTSNPSSPHGVSSTRTMATGAGGYPCSPTSHTRDSGLTGSDIYGEGLQQPQALDLLRRRSTTGTESVTTQTTSHGNGISGTGHGGGGPSFSSASIVYKSGPPPCAAGANGRTSEASSGGALKPATFSAAPPSISLPGVNRRSSDGSGSIGGLTAKPAIGKPKSVTSPSSSLSVHAAIATANRVNSLAGGMKHIIPQPRMSAQQQQQHHHHHQQHVDAPESPSVKPRDVSGDQPRQYQQHHHHHRSHHHLATDGGGHRGSCDGAESFHGHRHTGVDGDHRRTPTADEEDEAEAVFRFRDDDTIEREQLKIEGVEETLDDTPVIRPTRPTSLPVKAGDSPPPLRTGSGGADTPTNFAIEQVMGRGLGTSTKSMTEASPPPRSCTPPMDLPSKSTTSPDPLLPVDHRPLPSAHHHKHESFDQTQSPDSSYSSAAASVASEGHVRHESTTTADHRRHASTTEIAAH